MNKEIAKKRINPYNFLHQNLKIGFEINLDSHNIDHANSILTITPIFSEYVIETRYVIEIIKEMAIIYSRIINQYIFQCHRVSSASLYKID